MLTNEEVERFAAHYHRHGYQIEAAKYARPGISDREASDLGARILQSNHGQRELLKMKKETATFEPLGDYIRKLEEIRDAALKMGKYAPAVQAHMIIGKLAGFFDKPEADPYAVGDASQLSNEELLRRIESLTRSQPQLIEAKAIEKPRERE
jgi:hypothetical protein